MGLVTSSIPVKQDRRVEGLSRRWFDDALSSEGRQEDVSVIVKLGRSSQGGGCGFPLFCQPFDSPPESHNKVVRSYCMLFCVKQKLS